MSKIITISLPDELFARMEEKRKNKGKGRSAYFRQLVEADCAPTAKEIAMERLGVK